MAATIFLSTIWSIFFLLTISPLFLESFNKILEKEKEGTGQRF